MLAAGLDEPGMAGFGGAFIPGGGPACSASGPFLDNPVTSDPIRHARTAAILEAEPALALGAPTIAWADSALRAMADFASPAFPAKDPLEVDTPTPQSDRSVPA